MYVNKSSKLIIAILLITTLVIFSGCGGATPSNNETKITDVIHRFFQALSDQEWDTAKSYCVYGSTAYNDVNDIKEQWDLNFGEIEGIDLDYIVENIDTIIITGIYAEVNVFVNGILLYNGEIVEENPGETLILYLQKIDNDWKLYKVDEAETSISD
jgi:hypothetical protein